MDGSGRYVDPDAMVAAGQQFLETDDDPGPSFAPLSSLGPPKADVRAQVGEIDSLPIEECRRRLRSWQENFVDKVKLDLVDVLIAARLFARVHNVDTCPSTFRRWPKAKEARPKIGCRFIASQNLWTLQVTRGDWKMRTSLRVAEEDEGIVACVFDLCLILLKGPRVARLIGLNHDLAVCDEQGDILDSGYREPMVSALLRTAPDHYRRKISSTNVLGLPYEIHGYGEDSWPDEEQVPTTEDLKAKCAEDGFEWTWGNYTVLQQYEDPPDRSKPAEKKKRGRPPKAAATAAAKRRLVPIEVIEDSEPSEEAAGSESDELGLEDDRNSDGDYRPTKGARGGRGGGGRAGEGAKGGRGPGRKRKNAAAAAEVEAEAEAGDGAVPKRRRKKQPEAEEGSAQPKRAAGAVPAVGTPRRKGGDNEAPAARPAPAPAPAPALPQNKTAPLEIPFYIDRLESRQAAVRAELDFIRSTLNRTRQEARTYACRALYNQVQAELRQVAPEEIGPYVRTLGLDLNDCLNSVEHLRGDAFVRPVMAIVAAWLEDIRRK